MIRITTYISGITLNPIDEKEGPKHGDTFDYNVETEDEALDLFHRTVPIKVLDDYEIECQEIKPVAESYKGGVCPDCAETILKDSPEGSECHNCGHVFFSQ